MDRRSTPPERFSNAFDLAHEAAAAEAGFANFGDGDYRAGLRVVPESMEYTDLDPPIPVVAGMKGVQVVFPIGYTLRDFEYAADVLHAGAFDASSLITAGVPLAAIEAAFERLRGPNEARIQIAIGVHYRPGRPIQGEFEMRDEIAQGDAR